MNQNKRKARRTRIKFCGIGSVESAEAAIEAGADALGLVFYAPSPRAVTIDQAIEIAAIAHPFVTLVGLFVDATKAEIDSVLARVPLQLLQFHGDEPAEFCESFSLPYIKAVRVGKEQESLPDLDSHTNAQAFLFDTFKAGQPGGTGEVFDWNEIPDTHRPVILAGGLSAENVAKAITQIKPYAVDTSGGIESAPGVKDPDRMHAFIEQARLADLHLHEPTK